MKYRRLGRTDWQVSEVGYGMWGMAGWTGSDLDEVNRALRAAVALGCNFFDTAWGYGAGKSEAILGHLVRDFPDRKLYTATKIPPKNLKWPSRREFSVDDCFPPEHIEKYVTDSLKNAGLPSFDLMQLHTWEDSWLQDDRWYHKLSDLKSQGLFHAIGISQNRWEPWNGVAAVKSGLIDCVQVIYNIFDQNPQDELFPACRKHDVGVIARVPFDEGTLTGTLTKSSTWPKDDWRSSLFRSREFERERRPGGSAEALDPARHDDGGNGLAIYAVRADRGNGDPGHAIGPKCRSQHGGQRRRSVGRRLAAETRASIAGCGSRRNGRSS